MPQTLASPMTRKGGRPKAKPDDEAATRMIRVFGDVGRMMSWITRVTGESSAQYLDPLIRQKIVADFATFYPQILALKRAEDDAAKAANKEPGDPLPELPAGTTPAEPDKPKRKKP